MSQLTQTTIQFRSKKKIGSNKENGVKKSSRIQSSNSLYKASKLESPIKKSKNEQCLSPIKFSTKNQRIQTILSPAKNVHSNAENLVSIVNKKSLLAQSKSPCKNIKLVKPNIDVYRKLKQSLSNNADCAIIGREKEQNTIKSFLSECFSQEQPGSMYVSGVPGTGKTASILKMVDKMKNDKVKKIYLNCMNLMSTNDIFYGIASELGIKTKGKEADLLKAIEKKITRKNSVLLILDEVDQLESKNQSLLYTVFEWPSLQNSKLVLIGIANMLDFTDRVLPRLRANVKRPILVNFPPYSKTEITSIINERIKAADVKVDVFKPMTVSFLAGKIAAIAGDLRKALDICHRAVDLVEAEVREQSTLLESSLSQNSVKQVDMVRINNLFGQIYGNRITMELNNNPNSFPVLHKLLICVLLLFLKFAKSKDINASQLHEVYCKVCSKKNIPSVSQSEFLSACSLLECRGILEVRKAKEPRYSKILLRLSEEESANALGDKNLLASVLEDKESLGKYRSLKL